MRNFRRILSFTAALMLLLTGVTAPVRQAKAERVWLIEDSNTRKLTKAELWQWNYEALGYILNEIFARHGYVFKVKHLIKVEEL